MNGLVIIVNFVIAASKTFDLNNKAKEFSFNLSVTRRDAEHTVET
jgi:hypothetical protein